MKSYRIISKISGYMDGSVALDLPLERLRELFNVNHFIVSQVNPHVIPFLFRAQSLSDAAPLQRLIRYLGTEVNHIVTSVTTPPIFTDHFFPDCSVPTIHSLLWGLIVWLQLWELSKVLSGRFPMFGILHSSRLSTVSRHKTTRVISHSYQGSHFVTIRWYW